MADMSGFVAPFPMGPFVSSDARPLFGNDPLTGYVRVHRQSRSPLQYCQDAIHKVTNVFEREKQQPTQRSARKAVGTIAKRSVGDVLGQSGATKRSALSEVKESLKKLLLRKHKTKTQKMAQNTPTSTIDTPATVLTTTQKDPEAISFVSRRQCTTLNVYKELPPLPTEQNDTTKPGHQSQAPPANNDIESLEDTVTACTELRTEPANNAEPEHPNSNNKPNEHPAAENTIHTPEPQAADPRFDSLLTIVLHVKAQLDDVQAAVYAQGKEQHKRQPLAPYQAAGTENAFEELLAMAKHTTTQVDSMLSRYPTSAPALFMAGELESPKTDESSSITGANAAAVVGISSSNCAQVALGPLEIATEDQQLDRCVPMYPSSSLDTSTLSTDDSCLPAMGQARRVQSFKGLKPKLVDLSLPSHDNGALENALDSGHEDNQEVDDDFYFVPKLFETMDLTEPPKLEQDQLTDQIMPLPDDSEDNKDENSEGGSECEHDSDMTSISSSKTSEGDGEDDESDEDDEDDEDAEQRLIWGPIKDIEDSNIKALTRRFIDRPVDEITNVTQNSGMNNAVYIVHYNSVPEICVRVPACGWPGKWTNQDRDQVKHTVDMMKFLEKNTSMPIPKVLHYDLEMENEINAPYIAMKFINGKSPIDVWYGRGSKHGGMHWIDMVTREKVNDPEEHPAPCIAAYKPLTNELEQIRQTMLKTLAISCAELRRWTFSHYGLPVFSDDGEQIIGIGTRQWRSLGVFARSDCSATHICDAGVILPQPCMKTYLHDCLDEWSIKMGKWHAEDLKDKDEDGSDMMFRMKQQAGYVNFLKLVVDLLCEAPLSKLAYFSPATWKAGVEISSGETAEVSSSSNSALDSGSPVSIVEANPGPFVLMAHDFGSQNLICDPDTGAITGFIDWDNTVTKPKFAGWNSLPLWLRHDWAGVDYYCYPVEGYTMHADDFDRYRADYARYLREACEADGNSYGVDDWKFTERGGPIAEVLDAILDGRVGCMDMQKAANKVIHAVFPRIDENDFVGRLLSKGHICDQGLIDMIKDRLIRYFVHK